MSESLCELKKANGGGSKPTKTQTVTVTTNNAYVTVTFDQLEEVVGIIEATAYKSTAYSINGVNINNIVGNTVQVRSVREDASAPTSWTITAIGY